MLQLFGVHAYLQADSSHGFKFRRYTVSTWWLATQSGSVVRAHCHAFLSSCCFGAILAAPLIQWYLRYAAINCNYTVNTDPKTRMDETVIVYIHQLFSRYRTSRPIIVQQFIINREVAERSIHRDHHHLVFSIKLKQWNESDYKTQ